MIGDMNRVLRKRCVLVRVWMTYGRAYTLHIIVRHLVCIGPEWRQRQAAQKRQEGEGIDIDWIENEFAAEVSGEKIVNASQQRVPTKLKGMTLAFTTDGFRAVQAVLASFARQNVRTSYAVENAGNA